jgi:hypothetical protein
MITPDNKIPFDDSQASEADDQQSQKDIHSNGIDEAIVPQEEQADQEMLQQAYDAAEPSFTLKLDDDLTTDPKDKKD